MAEQYTKDLKFALSTIPEATFNTALTADTDYTGLALEAYPTPLPTPEQTALPSLGDFPTDFCNGYFAPVQMGFNVPFSFTGLMGRLWLQAFGSSVTAAQQGGTSAYKHSATMQTAAALKGRSAAIVNGAYSFLFAGNVVDTIAMSQVGGQLPVCEVGMLGTAKYTTACPFTPPSGSFACPPVPTTTITLTDDSETARSIYDEKVYSWRLNYANGADATSNLVRLGSDSLQGPTGGKAKYVNSIIKSQNRQLSLSVRVPLEQISTGSEGYWDKLLRRQAITSVSVKLVGDQISGSYYYTWEVTIPEARWTAVAVQDESGIQAYDLVATPVYNASACGVNLINITTSNYK